MGFFCQIFTIRSNEVRVLFDSMNLTVGIKDKIGIRELDSCVKIEQKGLKSIISGN